MIVVERYFVIVTGEEVPLARVEAQALLATASIDSSIEWHGRVGFFSANKDPMSFILSRAVYVREGGIVKAEASWSCDFDKTELLQTVRPNETFCVRVFDCSRPRASMQDLAATIGGILKRATGARVSLTNAIARIMAIKVGKRILLARSQLSRVRAGIYSRSSRKRTFFHPSLMNVRLARAMCNLAGVMPRGVLLDPFCGAGGILCEAAEIGASVVGMDLNFRLLRGAMVNLQQVGAKEATLVNGDVRFLPISNCDYIVTDPPYGRVSSTRGERAVRLVNALLEAANGIVNRGGKLCICSDSRMKVGEIIKHYGKQPEMCVKIRVHGGLVREVFTVRY
ncbi:MAG: hypothetical protein DRO73_04040 [Candidatus Thorarchaeota archaeon]|nr:MAG: hypothetical protein DRO73_04040 [Candidatus Thorarchaeota archaeon]